MADLNRALSHIVANLSQLLSKISNNTQELNTKKLKKNPNITYHQFLSEVLAGKNLPFPRTMTSPYSLHEDLELLLQLSSTSNISIKSFEAIAAKNIIHRSPKSMQQRYSSTLFSLQQNDIKNIVAWIENKGLAGYLDSQNGFKVVASEPTPPKKRQRAISLEKQAQSQQRKNKIVKTAKIPGNCKQLHQTLKVYSKMVNIPMKTLLSKLDQVSGDLAQLTKYVQTKDARLLWSASEDQILRKGGQQLEILKRYRGSAAMETRKKYLGLA